MKPSDFAGRAAILLSLLVAGVIELVFLRDVAAPVVFAVSGGDQCPEPADRRKPDPDPRMRVDQAEEAPTVDRRNCDHADR
ncbi:hypothetical protein [Catenulispora rubra]|uniref:hypothetical protein n=1 Tax=Catenulispora rubra TaxID=280293 RepID=UPI0018927F8D|nr:hypothetical protein [Catenulispora rubra]